MGSSFIGNSYYSTLSDFVAVTTLSIIFMWLCECKYIWMQICIFVVMFVLPRSHKPRQRYFNNKAFQLIQKDPDIVSQEISLLEHIVNLGGVCLIIMQPSWSATLSFMAFIIMMIHKFTKLVFMGRWKFSHVTAIEILLQKKFLLGCGLTRDAFDYSNLFQS